ncbi:MAG: hypothetical protein ABFC57_05300 [Veillonellales bacterium]
MKVKRSLGILLTLKKYHHLTRNNHIELIATFNPLITRENRKNGDGI